MSPKYPSTSVPPAVFSLLQQGDIMQARTVLFECIHEYPGNYAARNKLRFLYKKYTQRVSQGEFSCPCCGNAFPTFLPGGPSLRPDACCPACESLERQRALALLPDMPDMSDTPTIPPIKNRQSAPCVLHVAPESCLTPLFKKKFQTGYCTMDRAASADIRADMEALPFANGSVDIFIASHVLEHVTNDTRALQEIYRILSPTGMGVVLVPIDFSLSKTQEAPCNATPEQCFQLFGQEDHLRQYGQDFPCKLSQSGFTVTTKPALSLTTRENSRRYGLSKADIFYLLSKEAKTMPCFS